MSYINMAELADLIELAKKDFSRHFGEGELEVELEAINGQEIIVVSNGAKKVYYAFRPNLKELEVTKVINNEGNH